MDIHNPRCHSKNPDASGFCCACTIMDIARASVVIGEKDKPIEWLAK